MCNERKSVLFNQISLVAVKEYWNRRPCNIRHSTQPVGTREYFDEVEARKHFVEPHIPDFAEFERWRGKKVLEIGCGLGTATINFARAGAERHSGGPVGKVAGTRAAARRGLSGCRSAFDSYSGDAEESANVRAGGDLRPDLFVRCDPPHAAPAARPG